MRSMSSERRARCTERQADCRPNDARVIPNDERVIVTQHFTAFQPRIFMRVVTYAQLEAAGVTQESINTLKTFLLLRRAQVAEGFMMPATLAVYCPPLPQHDDYGKVFNAFMECAIDGLSMPFEKAALVRKEGEKKICLFSSLSLRLTPGDLSLRHRFCKGFLVAPRQECSSLHLLLLQHLLLLLGEPLEQPPPCLLLLSLLLQLRLSRQSNQQRRVMTRTRTKGTRDSTFLCASMLLPLLQWHTSMFLPLMARWKHEQHSPTKTSRPMETSSGSCSLEDCNNSMFLLCAHWMDAWSP